MNLRSILVLYFVVASCSSELQTQARAANAIASAANGVLPQLIALYREEGIRRIRSAPDRLSAERDLRDLRAQWRPLWGDCDGPDCRGGAWEGLRAAHDAWAQILERQMAGEQMSLPTVIEMTVRLQRNFCAVRGAVPAETRARIPAIPGVRCDVDLLDGGSMVDATEEPHE